jgi:2-dehydro-3-deoxygluconokinase
MMKPVFCFGEIMARLAPSGHLRFRQAMPGTLEITFAGAEVNTAAAIAALGGEAEVITAFPENEITEAALAAIRAAGVGVKQVIQRPVGRFGLFFMETGANQRAGMVLYDRENSTFSQTPASAYPWAEIMTEAGWFHTSGIAAGVTREAAEATLAGLRAAEAAGVAVSCDLNFRRKLWRWDEAFAPEELARRTLRTMLPLVDVVIGNPADLSATVGLPVEKKPTPRGLARLARALATEYPRVRWVAITLREGVSATHNRWGAMLYDVRQKKSFFSPLKNGRYQPHEIVSIVDRVGTGDVFAGALIHALRTPELAHPATALAFAVAASCLAHSTKGDFCVCRRSEVEALVAGGNGGMVAR